MGGISGFAINVAVLALILYFMLIGGAKMEKYVYSILPFSDENKKKRLERDQYDRHLQRNRNSVAGHHPRLIALLGYWIFDVPSPFLFGFLTCFATIIPVVGTALVWLPLALYMTLTGDWVNAAGLTALCFDYHYECGYLIRFILQKKMADYSSAHYHIRCDHRLVSIRFYGNYLWAAPDFDLYTLFQYIQGKVSG